MHVLQAGGLSSRVEGAVQEAKKRDLDDLHQDGETRVPGMWIACFAALTHIHTAGFVTNYMSS